VSRSIELDCLECDAVVTCYGSLTESGDYDYDIPDECPICGDSFADCKPCDEREDFCRGT